MGTAMASKYGRPTLICTPLAASTSSGNTVPTSTVKVKSTKSRLFSEERALAAHRVAERAVRGQRVHAEREQHHAEDQRDGEEDEDRRADRALGEGVDGVEDAGARHERAQDREQERGQDQRHRPALQDALALGEDRGVQRRGGGEPGQERRVLHRVPGPVAAPAQHLVRPPAAEHDGHGEEDPRQQQPRRAARHEVVAEPAAQERGARRGRTGSSSPRSRGTGTAGGSSSARGSGAAGSPARPRAGGASRRPCATARPPAPAPASASALAPALQRIQIESQPGQGQLASSSPGGAEHNRIVPGHRGTQVAEPRRAIRRSPPSPRSPTSGPGAPR